jgi:hypothetical protein
MLSSLNVYFVCVVLSQTLVWVNLSWEDLISRVACGLRSKGEGSYLAGGIGYLLLARLSLWLLGPRVDSPTTLVESYLEYLRCEILRKNGAIFLGGEPPAVAPEGDLVFGGKPSHPLTLFNDEIYICATN